MKYKIEFIENPDVFSENQLTLIRGGVNKGFCLLFFGCDCKGSYLDEPLKSDEASKNTVKKPNKKGVKKIYEENIWVKNDKYFCFIVSSK